jgi:trehalose 6-phosphate phosphatase
MVTAIWRSFAAAWLRRRLTRKNAASGVILGKGKQIDALLRAVSAAPESLLMLDYDGTLAAFCCDPELAAPYAGVPSLLQAIVDTGRTRVVIISGRDARDVVPLLDITPRPEIWGLHGLQRLMPDGILDVTPLDSCTLAALTEASRILRKQELQATAEFKIGSVAVHWRGMEEKQAEGLRRRVLTHWRPLSETSGLHLLEFDGGVEIRAPEVDKGDAVLTLLREMAPAAPAAYLGDDTTDEHAFEALEGNGLSVLVRPRWRKTAADVWLKPPDELRDFLADWLQACKHSMDDNRSSLMVNK